MEGVNATPYEDNMRYFNVAIAGPVGTCYEGNSCHAWLNAYIVILSECSPNVLQSFYHAVKKASNNLNPSILKPNESTDSLIHFSIYFDCYCHWLIGWFISILIWLTNMMTTDILLTKYLQLFYQILYHQGDYFD